MALEYDCDASSENEKLHDSSYLVSTTFFIFRSFRYDYYLFNPEKLLDEDQNNNNNSNFFMSIHILLEF
jgi:hypothetical protein